MTNSTIFIKEINRDKYYEYEFNPQFNGKLFPFNSQKEQIILFFRPGHYDICYYVNKQEIMEEC